MEYLRIRNWDKFQHYKTRTPPWIKLHKTLLDDFDFASLPDASKALAPYLWLLASESDDGTIPADVNWIAFRVHKLTPWVEGALKPLIDKGFVINASNVLAERLQDACLEVEEETEVEREGEVEHNPPSPQGGNGAISKNSSNKSPEFKIWVNEVFDAWNDMAGKHGLPVARKLTTKRKSALSERWNDVDFRENWRAALEIVPNSDFCCGRQANSNWRAHFDFFLRPDTYSKLLEGTYGGESQTRNQYRDCPI